MQIWEGLNVSILHFITQQSRLLIILPNQLHLCVRAGVISETEREYVAETQHKEIYLMKILVFYISSINHIASLYAAWVKMVYIYG